MICGAARRALILAAARRKFRRLRGVAAPHGLGTDEPEGLRSAVVIVFMGTESVLIESIYRLWILFTDFDAQCPSRIEGRQQFSFRVGSLGLGSLTNGDGSLRPCRRKTGKV
jgi:hypothetical protein